MSHLVPLPLKEVLVSLVDHVDDGSILLTYALQAEVDWVVLVPTVGLQRPVELIMCQHSLILAYHDPQTLEANAFQVIGLMPPLLFETCGVDGLSEIRPKICFSFSPVYCSGVSFESETSSSSRSIC